jgi:predicted aspartyl protease
LPTINVRIAPSGPIITALVGVSQPREEALIKAGQAVPDRVEGRFLVDTGASCTCVDPDFIKTLGLPVINRVPIQTPSTNGKHHHCDLCDGSIALLGKEVKDVYYIPAMPMLATQLKSQGIDGLIGRDILNLCTLVIVGSAGLLSLSH